MLGQRMLIVGVFRQVTGSLTKPLDDKNALFRFHDDEREGPMLNCRSIWFQNARNPLLVVTELLNVLLNIVRARTGSFQDLKHTDDIANFTAAAGEMQMINTDELSRVQLLAFFINTYNLMALHGHVLRGSHEKSDFKPHKLAFTRDNHYMVAAYNYSLCEIEERLFCRVLRAKYPMSSDRSRAPEPRVHFALSLGCASSPAIRIYEPDSLDDDLQDAATEYLIANLPKEQVRTARAALAAGETQQEVTLPKIFKFCREDFGFSKQEILAYYASFMPQQQMESLIEVARANNFVIKYHAYDWKINMTKACA